MIAVIVRDDDDIDRLGIDAGGREIDQELAGRALAVIDAASPVPVSMSTTFPPVLTTIGLYGVAIMSFSR